MEFSLKVLLVGVSFDISSASNVTANEADPQRFVGFAFRAAALGCHLRGLQVPANRTPFKQKNKIYTVEYLSERCQLRGVAPLGQAGAVEAVVAQDGQDTVHRLVHSLQANGADG